MLSAGLGMRGGMPGHELQFGRDDTFRGRREPMNPECLRLKERAKAIRSEYAKRLMSGGALEHRDLYERISDLSLQLEHRLDCPPQEVTKVQEELREAIVELESLKNLIKNQFRHDPRH